MWSRLHGLVDDLMKLGPEAAFDDEGVLKPLNPYSMDRFKNLESLPRYIQRFVNDFKPVKLANKNMLIDWQKHKDVIWTRKRDGWFILIYRAGKNDVKWRTNGDISDGHWDIITTYMQPYIKHLNSLGNFTGALKCELVVVDKHDTDYLHLVDKELEPEYTRKLVICDYMWPYDHTMEKEYEEKKATERKRNNDAEYLSAIGWSSITNKHRPYESRLKFAQTNFTFNDIQIVEYGNLGSFDCLEYLRSKPWEGLVLHTSQRQFKVKLEYYEGEGHEIRVRLQAIRLVEGRTAIQYLAYGYDHIQTRYITDIAFMPLGDFNGDDFSSSLALTDKWDTRSNHHRQLNDKQKTSRDLMNNVKILVRDKKKDLRKFTLSSTFLKQCKDMKIVDNWFDVNHESIVLIGGANHVWQGKNTMHLQGCIIRKAVRENNHNIPWTFGDWTYNMVPSTFNYSGYRGVQNIQRSAPLLLFHDGKWHPSVTTYNRIKDEIDEYIRTLHERAHNMIYRERMFARERELYVPARKYFNEKISEFIELILKLNHAHYTDRLYWENIFQMFLPEQYGDYADEEIYNMFMNIPNLKQEFKQFMQQHHDIHTQRKSPKSAETLYREIKGENTREQSPERIVISDEPTEEPSSEIIVISDDDKPVPDPDDSQMTGIKRPAESDDEWQSVRRVQDAHEWQSMRNSLSIAPIRPTASQSIELNAYLQIDDDLQIKLDWELNNTKSTVITINDIWPGQDENGPMFTLNVTHHQDIISCTITNNTTKIILIDSENMKRNTTYKMHHKSEIYVILGAISKTLTLQFPFLTNTQSLHGISFQPTQNENFDNVLKLFGATIDDGFGKWEFTTNAAPSRHQVHEDWFNKIIQNLRNNTLPYIKSGPFDPKPTTVSTPI